MVISAINFEFSLFSHKNRENYYLPKFLSMQLVCDALQFDVKFSLSTLSLNRYMILENRSTKLKGGKSDEK